MIPLAIIGMLGSEEERAEVTGMTQYVPVLRDLVAIENHAKHVAIEYRDDGPGYPDALIEGDLSFASVGLELIQGITVQSLGGEIGFRNDHGAVTTVRFEKVGLSRNPL